MNAPFIAYKAFNKNQTCRGFKFEEGETYTIDNPPILCKQGFHFCRELIMTLQYYPVKSSINENLYAEVEILGDVDWEELIGYKGCTDKIKIKKFLSCAEVLSLISKNSTGDWNTGNLNTGDLNTGNWNTGHLNTGNRNTGNWNTGHRNTGHRNTGHLNTGNRNTGNWNTCNKETGFFNTQEPPVINVFNKPCCRQKWDNINKPSFIYFNIDKELGYKESFKKRFENATDEDIELLKKLPNFDRDVFFEISGIMVD